jgi:hypothetical protein
MKKRKGKTKRKPVVKPSNPKQAMGIKKVPMSCLSSQAIALVAQAMVAENLEKYAKHKKVVVSEHINAAISYFMNFWEGVGDDMSPPMIARAMARLMVLRSAQIENRLKDDRISTDGLHVRELNAKAVEIIEQYPNCVDPFIELPNDTVGFKVPVEITNVIPFNVLPWRVVMETALGMMEGGRKYGRHNYRAMGVRATVYYDASMRHCADFIEGTATDRDSGLSHITKALSSTQVMLDSMIMGNWIDDRPMRVK